MAYSMWDVSVLVSRASPRSLDRARGTASPWAPTVVGVHPLKRHRKDPDPPAPEGDGERARRQVPESGPTGGEYPTAVGSGFTVP